MTKKTSETKPGNQAESKQPTELKDEHLDKVQGGSVDVKIGQEAFPSRNAPVDKPTAPRRLGGDDQFG